jgi:dolichol-phosphate mannosyltransferase
VCRSTFGEDYEIVLVDDGSSDSTWPYIRDLALQDPHVVAATLSRNHGHQLALTAGLSLCRGERILVIDADLQDPPEMLPEMMRLMDEGADVVYGQRVHREGESWFKRTTANVFYRLLARLTSVPIPTDSGDFRLMTRRVRDVLEQMPEDHRFIRGMVSWVGFKQVALPYKRAPRLAGKTKYPLKNMVLFALDAITGFSIFPLTLIFFISLGAALASFLLLTYVAYSWFVNDVIPGWASIMFVLLVMGSLHLCALAVIGQYVGRTYMQSKNRPLFLIGEVVCQPSAGRQPIQDWSDERNKYAATSGGNRLFS